MKKTLLIVGLIVLFSLIFNQGYAADRVILLEMHTSTTCGPCVSGNQVVNEIENTHGDNMAIIRYHVWWPSPGNDPFYHANTEEATVRTEYYGVSGVPNCTVDGTDAGWPPDLWPAAAQGQVGVPSPLTIDLDVSVSGEITATIFAEETLSGIDNVVHFVLTESDIHYTGPNGDPIHDQVMRDMLPDANGHALNISQGQTVTMTVAYNMDPSWNPATMEAVVFVQNNQSKEIYQAAKATIPVPGHYFTAEFDAHATLVAPDAVAEFHGELQNIGQEPDTYHVVLNKTGLPAGWFASFCSGQICVLDSVNLPTSGDLAPEGTLPLLIDIQPMGNAGSGTAVLEINSINNPAIAFSWEFSVTSGAELLIVDDDAGQDYETYYQDAVAAAGKFAGTLAPENVSIELALSFPQIIWLTGNDYSTTLTTENMTLLSAFLDNGGSLFLSGQDIGYDINSDPFYADYIHANYLNDDTNGTVVTGVADDPITSGLSLNITGGDGANNQLYPSEIEAINGATPIFHYGSTTQQAGLRVNTEVYKLVYLAFGFEAVNNAADRHLLMANVLNWLDPANAVEDETVVGIKTALAQNFPNPFNPTTVISFSLARNEHVSLNVFNTTGQLVKTLINMPLETGPHTIQWDGLNNNASTVASGVYFYRLKTETGFDETRSMLLLK